MKIARLVLYLALGFMARSLYLLFFGTGGLVDFRSLESHREQLEGNLAELRRINAELMEEQRALGTDPERVSLQARELGYYRPGEQVVRLEGHGQPRRSFTVGALIGPRAKQERQDWIPKMLGLIVPLVLFVVALGRDGRRHRAPEHR
ncbi:MAG: septum formation initiator family protein [Spirochaetales bacterium]|nr:septum formation initiator family protein [Spirochaetales bacterium]